MIQKEGIRGKNNEKNGPWMLRGPLQKRLKDARLISGAGRKTGEIKEGERKRERGGGSSFSALLDLASTCGKSMIQLFGKG